MKRSFGSSPCYSYCTYIIYMYIIYVYIVLLFPLKGVLTINAGIVAILDLHFVPCYALICKKNG